MQLPDLPHFKSIPENAFEDLVLVMRAFQNALSDDMEVGISANGGEMIIRVEAVDLSGQMAIFGGVDDHGRKAVLIQHYTQISVQMVAVAKSESQARRIGFAVGEG